MSDQDLGTRLKANLRTLSWLDAGRVRVYAAMILVAYVPMMVKVFREATGTVGSDFLAFWGTGRLLLSGPAPRVYDLASEHAAQMAAGTGQMVAYVNPPPFLFLAAPLGLMPYAVAWIVWALAGWAIWFLVARRALPDAGAAAALVVLAFPGAYLAASHAQNGFVTGALLIAAVLTPGAMGPPSPPPRPRPSRCASPRSPSSGSRPGAPIRRASRSAST